MTQLHSPILEQNGETGDLTWRLSGSTLTISGTGAMPDYIEESDAPWLPYCEAITNLVIEEGVTYIGQFAFADCLSLASATIPGSVTSVGGFAFANCDSLASAAIPGGVTRIGGDAFANCRSLASVNIPHSITEIEVGAFSGCSLASVTIPHSVTRIGDSAFAACSLTSVTIPASVTEIGEGVFAGCDSLTSITVETGNPSYSSDKGVLFNKDKTLLLQYPEEKTGEYAIPGSVTEIGVGAFAGCRSLTDVTIPGSVTEIGEYAFEDCRSLTDVTIPGSVTEIGEYAFSFCRSLTDVTVEWATPLSIESDIFDDVPLPSVTLHVPEGTKPLYEAADVWNRFGTITER